MDRNLKRTIFSSRAGFKARRRSFWMAYRLGNACSTTTSLRRAYSLVSLVIGERRKLTFAGGSLRSLEAMAMSTSRSHRCNDSRFVPSPELKENIIFTTSLREGREVQKNTNRCRAFNCLEWRSGSHGGSLFSSLLVLCERLNATTTSGDSRRIIVILNAAGVRRPLRALLNSGATNNSFR